MLHTGIEVGREGVRELFGRAPACYGRVMDNRGIYRNAVGINKVWLGDNFEAAMAEEAAHIITRKDRTWVSLEDISKINNFGEKLSSEWSKEFSENEYYVVLDEFFVPMALDYLGIEESPIDFKRDLEALAFKDDGARKASLRSTFSHLPNLPGHIYLKNCESPKNAIKSGIMEVEDLWE